MYIYIYRIKSTTVGTTCFFELFLFYQVCVLPFYITCVTLSTKLWLSIKFPHQELGEEIKSSKDLTIV